MKNENTKLKKRVEKTLRNFWKSCSEIGGKNRITKMSWLLTTLFGGSPTRSSTTVNKYLELAKKFVTMCKTRTEMHWRVALMRKNPQLLAQILAVRKSTRILYAQTMVAIMERLVVAHGNRTLSAVLARHDFEILLWNAVSELSYATIRRYLVVWKFFKLPHEFDTANLRKALKNSCKQTVQQREPLFLSDIDSVYVEKWIRQGSKGLTKMLALSVQTAACLRASELLALRGSDVRERRVAGKKVIEITVRKSKTAMRGRAEKVLINRQRYPQLNKYVWPVLLMRARNKRKRLWRIRVGNSRRNAQRSDLTSWVREAAKHAGNDERRYASHSCRIGGALELKMTGESTLGIAAKGRWKSHETVLRYVKKYSELTG